MKVLVSGGAGFIGSNVVDALVEAGHDLVVVDNLSTGFRERVNPAARLYEMSIGDPRLADVFQRERPDVVNHHAAQMVVTKSVENPVYDAQENILGGLGILLNSVRFGVKKFIYASSGGAVYGEAQYLPADEQHPIKPVSQYGVSKHTLEHYLHLYAALYGLPYVVLRYANVYGEGQNPFGEAGVVAIFARQMLRGERPTIFGSGDKTRDYVHISDVVKANLLALEKGENTIYNIGTGVETSDQQVFDTLAEVLGHRGKPFYAPVRKGEIHRICLDCTKAKKELAWAPALSFKEGLLRAADYYKTLSLKG
ncbi:MAG: NAD-dependent epimerase/dehydratase family protein [Dehalococcoidia bacterium]|nr:NAD-dependent epimerase/dehydratase family protein [Dehalococcoidia bacterium]